MQVGGQHEVQQCIWVATGEWVSNEYPTCPVLRDSPAKAGLIPDGAYVPHGTYVKDSSARDGDASD